MQLVLAISVSPDDSVFFRDRLRPMRRTLKRRRLRLLSSGAWGVRLMNRFLSIYRFDIGFG
ncbi:hypothetical protein HanIR_Chr16g0797361 [Helianthus annuus]|nr:hypothetical protein HanIR_Chr16g0797361 [Helianthus annuus]